METRKHVHVEEFEVTPKRLFSILYTPSAIRSWWGAASVIVVPEEGGLWVASWGEEDDPDYITSARIQQLQVPYKMVLTDYRYYSKFGPLPFEADFVTEFLVKPIGHAALLRVSQDGFPIGREGDAFLVDCEKGWIDSFAGIRRFLNEAKG